MTHFPASLQALDIDDSIQLEQDGSILYLSG